MSGIMTSLWKIYEMKKAQLEAAYNKQRREVKLKDDEIRHVSRSTRNMAMSASEEKLWTRWNVMSLLLKSQSEV